jgi:hypothetical protein
MAVDPVFVIENPVYSSQTPPIYPVLQIRLTVVRQPLAAL